MWKNTAESGRPQMTMSRMRIAFWTPKSTNTQSKYTILIALLLQQWQHKCAPMSCYMHIVFLVLCDNHTQYSSEACAQNGQRIVFKLAVRIVTTKV